MRIPLVSSPKRIGVEQQGESDLVQQGQGREDHRGAEAFGRSGHVDREDHGDHEGRQGAEVGPWLKNQARGVSLGVLFWDSKPKDQKKFRALPGFFFLFLFWDSKPKDQKKSCSNVRAPNKWGLRRDYVAQIDAKKKKTSFEMQKKNKTSFDQRSIHRVV